MNKKTQLPLNHSPSQSHIHLHQSLTILKSKDKNLIYLRHYKYVKSYRFNLETKQEANLMRNALKRLKYIAKLSNVQRRNLKKPKTYEEAFKPSYKTTLKMQNRFSFSSFHIPALFHKFTNRLVPAKLTYLDETLSKCPLSIYINHKNLQFLRLGLFFKSLDTLTAKQLTKLLSRLKKLKVLGLWIEDIDLGQLYHLIKSSSQSIQEVSLKTSAFLVEKRPEKDAKLPLSHLKIDEKGNTEYQAFSLYPKFFQDLKSVSIVLLFPHDEVNLLPLNSLISLPSLTQIQFTFQVYKGAEDIFEILSNLCEARPDTLEKISASFQSNDFLRKSLEDILLNLPNIIKLEYLLQIINKKAHANFTIAYSRPNPLIDLMSPFISTDLESLSLNISPVGNFVNPLKAEKLIILLNLSSNLKSFVFKSTSLALTKGFIMVKNQQLEEVSFMVDEVEYFMKEHFKQFLQAFTGVKNLKKFYYSTKQTFYNADICQALANFAKASASLKLLQVELDITGDNQDRSIQGFIKDLGGIVKKDLTIELKLKNANQEFRNNAYKTSENLKLVF